MSSQGENYQGESSLPSTPISLTPTPSSSPTKTSPARKRKLRSSIWNDFDKQSEQGNDIAVCHHCKSKLKTSSRNWNLHVHLKRCAKRKNVDISEEFLVSSQGKTDGKLIIHNFTFDPELSRRNLARMIILHEYPLSIVNHSGLQKFLSSLHPLFKMGSLDAIKSDVLKIYDSEKAKSFELLDQLRCRIAITANLWTCGQYKGYMAITAHFIDDAWVLNSRMLRFIYVPVPHVKEVVADALMDCLLEWNIDHKVSTITVDIGSTDDDGIIDILVDRLSTNGSLLLNGKMLHMRCFASVLNLIVKDGVYVIGEGVEKICDSVLFWSATPQRIEKFEEVARQLCIPCTNNLGLFCKTQWNSTYLMLQTALPYKDVFLRLKQCEKLYTCVPSEEEWSLAQEICDKLKEIHSAIEFFSDTAHTTSSHYFPMVCEIRQRLYKWVMDPSKVISEMATYMIEKLEKYWSGCHMMVAKLADVLDPRYKMKFVEYYYLLIYGQDAETEIEKVREICNDLLDEYEDRFKVQEAHKSGATSLHPNSMVMDNDVPDLLLEFQLLVQRSSNNGHVKSELDRYLDERVMPRAPGFDVLSYWRTEGIKFPILQRIARDIMAIPMSTVASKEAFSNLSKVVSTQHSRLHPETLEALMCAKDWLWKDMGAEPSCAFTIDADDESL